MRILLVSGSAPPLRCGVGDYTAELARALAAQQGVEVALLTGQGAASSESAGYEVFPVLDGWSISEIPAALALMRRWKPDIVHLQYPSLGYGTSIMPSLIPALAWGAGAVPMRTWHEAFSGRQSINFLLQSAAPGPYIVVRPNFAELMWPPLRPLLGHRTGRFIAGASSIPRSTIADADRELLRARYLGGKSRLVVFFGFLYPSKGAEYLFDIANPENDALVFAGNADVDPEYTGKVRARCHSAEWSGHAACIGYLPVEEIADLLAAADVVVLPFVSGGGSWNSSISAAVLQGTPVLTTGNDCQGLDPARRIYFAKPNDIADLRNGLSVAADMRRAETTDPVLDDWLRIAQEHAALYRSALVERNGRS